MLEKYVEIKVKVKQFGFEEIEVGDYVEYNNKVYKFIGYEWGTYPIGEDVETGETVTLPHY